MTWPTTGGNWRRAGLHHKARTSTLDTTVGYCCMCVCVDNPAKVLIIDYWGHTMHGVNEIVISRRRFCLRFGLVLLEAWQRTAMHHASCIIHFLTLTLGHQPRPFAKGALSFLHLQPHGSLAAPCSTIDQPAIKPVHGRAFVLSYIYHTSCSVTGSSQEQRYQIGNGTAILCGYI